MGRGDKISAEDVGPGAAVALGRGAKATIINKIQNIQQRALTAAEEAEQAKSIAAQHLAQGVSAFAQRLQARASESPDADKGGPYRGLLEYRLSDAEIFFGRAQAIRELLEHLQRGPLTVLHAESGAGKTSLLQAGISPRLIAAGYLPAYLRPYNVPPSLALKRAFLPSLGDTPNLAQAPLRDFLSRVSDVLGPQTTLYIFLDQFEEFFTQPVGAAVQLLPQPAHVEFVRELAECLDDESLNVRWVLALRSEFFGNLADFRPRIRNPFENDYRLNRLTRAEAREAVAEPAARRGITFEDGLIDQLLDDLGKDEVAPPQVQLVCSTLYEALSPGAQVITRDVLVDQLGGAAGILRGHLGRVLRRDLPAGQRPIAQRLLEALITSDIRRVLRTHTELAAELAPQGTPESLDAILSQLVDSRLLRIEEVGGELAYELAHDYLLDEIKLDPAVQARKAAQELLEQEVHTYKRYGTLLSDDKVAIIKAQRNELVLSDDARNLIRLSERTLRRRRGFVLGGMGLAVILIIVGAISILTAINAEQQKRKTFEKTGVVPVGALPRALAFDGTRLWVANQRDNTVQAIDPTTGSLGTPIQVGKDPFALTFDGIRIWVANSGDNTVQMIDPVTGVAGTPVPVGNGPSALAFDGMRLWVANPRDNTMQAINPATGIVGASIVVGRIPSALVFDGTRLWVANWRDDTVQAIDATIGIIVYAPIPVGNGPSDLVFDGVRLWVANTVDNTVQAIDPATGMVDAPIPVGNGPSALAFDGTRLWVANQRDNTMQVIDPITGIIDASIVVGSFPSALAFDGTRLWVASIDDSTVQAIDPAIGVASAPISVGAFPQSIVFDGMRLWVANSDDGTVQSIDPTTGETGEPILVGDFPWALAFDGTRLWVSDVNKTVHAVDPLSGETVTSTTVGAQPDTLAFDGTRVWVANQVDNTIQMIDPATGEASAPISVGRFPYALFFDGTQLWVANSGDNAVQAVDPVTGVTSKSVPVGNGPSGLTFDGTRLWVSNGSDNTVQAIDPTTGFVGTPVLVGEYPTALVFDGKQIWVANSNDNSVQTIDPATGTAGLPIPVGHWPIALAFDGARVWVANANSHTVQYIVVHKRVNE